MGAGLKLRLAAGGGSTAPLPRTHSNMILRRRGRLEFLKAGMLFRSRHAEGTVRTARILCFFTDGSGIAHVSFEAALERPALGRVAIGPRLLSLSAFAERFPERS